MNKEEILGNYVQNGVPTPDNPVPIICKEVSNLVYYETPLLEQIQKLQSQLDKSNNKIEKIKEYILKDDKRNDDSEDYNNELSDCFQTILSIIDEENK